MLKSEDNCADCGMPKDKCTLFPNAEEIAMSKEREGFALKLEKHFIFLEPENDDGISSGETVVPVDTVLEVATAHYQPLLDAKDAEIARLTALAEEYGKGRTKAAKQANEWFEENTTLKALLEQAREGLEFYRDEWQLNAEGDFSEPCLSRTWQEPTDKLWDDNGRKAELTLAAINAATGEK